MRKKLPVIIGICIFVYIGIFLIIMVGTHSLPSYVYENEKLIAKDLNSFNKINYRGYVNADELYIASDTRKSKISPNTARQNHCYTGGTKQCRGQRCCL